ncbi:MAG TPA: hypothetical protein VGL29_20995 [Blastocatellia bacterium]|jgi:hypothetical protein
MTPQFYVFVGFLILALTGALIWRRTGTKPVDWELVVAFIRRDFPPDQRDAAQEIAAVLAELVGIEIKQLRPEHTVQQIAEWAHYFFSIRVEDLAMVFRAEYGVTCDGNTTFRAVVEEVVENRKKRT